MTNRIIYLSLTLIGVLSAASFWVNPAYEKGVWLGMAALSNCLSAALGAKFGLAIPGHNAPQEPEPKGEGNGKTC